MEPNIKHALNTIECAPKPTSQPGDLTAKFLLDSLQHPDRRLIQAAAVTEGEVVGGLKQIPNQIINHPVETAGKIVIGVAAGAAFTAAAAIECPVVIAGLTLGGAGVLGLYAWNEGQKLSNDEKLQAALDHIWSTKSIRRGANYLPAVELSLGPEAFDLGLSVAATGGGNLMAKAISDVPSFAAQYTPKLNFITAGPRTRMPQPAMIGTAADAGDATTFKMSGHFNNYDNGSSEYGSRSSFVENLRNNETMETFLAKDSEKFFPEIDKTSLGARLDKLEFLIDKKDWRQAYEYANANMSWLANRGVDRTTSFDDNRICSVYDSFFKVSYFMQGHPHYNVPNEFIAKTHNVIVMTRENFAIDTTWPLRISPADACKEERILSMPLTQQLNEIGSLVDVGFYKDATKIANWCYLGERSKASNSKLTEEADNLLYLLCGRGVRHADSHKSTAGAIHAQIKILRKLSIDV